MFKESGFLILTPPTKNNLQKKIHSFEFIYLFALCDTGTQIQGLYFLGKCPTSKLYFHSPKDCSESKFKIRNPNFFLIFEFSFIQNTTERKYKTSKDTALERKMLI